MKSAKVLTLLLFTILPTICVAQKKPKKPVVPETFAHARFVYVEAMDGSEFDANLNPEDRIAIADVRDYLKKWGRYTISYERDKADLVFVVRRGRLAEANGNIGIGNRQDPQFPSGGQPSMGPPGGQSQSRQQQREMTLGVGGEVGPPDDMLQVCEFNVNNGKRSGPLWIRTEAHGLSAPRLLLLAQFKDELEKAYPAPLTTNSQGNGSTNGSGNGTGNGQAGTPGKP